MRQAFAAFPLALLLLAAAAGADAQERRSGYADMGPALQSMQDDDTANPGMLWVLEGEALWNRKQGAAEKSCADCHGAIAGMTGIATRYPAFSGDAVRTLDQRIALCRVANQKSAPWPEESKELLSLGAAVARQSRGLALAPPDDERLAPVAKAGAALWGQRQGQLNLSCAQCHDDNAGQKLAGAAIPQAHPTAYPVYRLEWQSLGSLQRRLRNCLIGMRAEPYALGAPEYVQLELYLKRRAGGMKFEAPGVRP
jgi:sulfur-oxidizing protein SoxA